MAAEQIQKPEEGRVPAACTTSTIARPGSRGWFGRGWRAAPSPAITLQWGVWNACCQGLGGGSCSVEKVTHIREGDTQTFSLPGALWVQPTSMLCHFMVVTYHPLKFPSCPEGCCPQRWGTRPLTPSPWGRTSILSAPLHDREWALGKKPALKLTSLWAPWSLMAHVGQLFLLLRLAVNLNEPCLTLQWHEWMINQT